MMSSASMILYSVSAGLLFGFGLGQEKTALEDGTCYTRFDYEYKVIQKLVQLEENQQKLRQTIQTQRDEIVTSQDQQSEMAKIIQDLTQQITTLETSLTAIANTSRADDSGSKSGQGSTYIRWGRTSCSGKGTELVYAGYAGGSLDSNPGGAAKYLCLPNDPVYGKFDNSEGAFASVFGAKYGNFGNLISTVKKGDDVPCAVCRSIRSSALMIPARKECYGGWTLEYHGYLITGFRDNKGASDYACVDEQSESVGGGSRDLAGKYFYQVDARCGTLRCPPYVHARELSCVVCSK